VAVAPELFTPSPLVASADAASSHTKPGAVAVRFPVHADELTVADTTCRRSLANKPIHRMDRCPVIGGGRYARARASHERPDPVVDRSGRSA
jgi:hypothetical protein